MKAIPSAVTSLTHAAPRVRGADAAELVREYYGLRAELTRMAGERDDNFRVCAEDGRTFALKILHPAEDPSVSDMQTEVLRHVSRVDPTLPVATVLASRDGEYTPRVANSGPALGRAMRLTTFRFGTPMRARVTERPVRIDFGAHLARTARALRSFPPGPGASPELPWDLARALDVRPLVGRVERADRRGFLLEFLDHFEHELAPRLRPLRIQWVHNDFNGDNILVGAHGRISAILDFGDMVATQLVNDVAIAATHVLHGDADPMVGVADLVNGYRSVTPLTEQEVRLIPELMTTRMVIRVAFSEWRAQRFPENASYILRDVARTWDQLEFMRARRVEDWSDELVRATLEASR